MRMNSKNFFASAGVAGLALCVFAINGAHAQAQAPGVLSVSEPVKLSVPRGGEVTETLKFQLKPGYHVNSNKPNEEYLIPIRLTWDSALAESVSVQYPKPATEKTEFSEQPLSVYTGDFEIVTKFRRAAKASPGPGFLNGKLRYQACNDKMCLPPKTLEIKVPLIVE